MQTRSRIACAVLLALAMAACWPFGFRPVSPDPRLALDREQHNFGDIPPTESVATVFTVSNTGGKTLDIARVQTTCGCTAGMMDSQKIEPGKSSRLRVGFDPRGKNGPQHKVLTLFTNDPMNPQKQIGITANIVSTPPPQAPAVPPASPGASPSATTMR